MTTIIYYLFFISIFYFLINFLNLKLKQRFFNRLWTILSPKVDKKLYPIKKRLFSDASGNVLDVGSGDGVTFKYLIDNSNDKVIKSITAVEPNQFMQSKLKENANKLSNDKIKINIVSKTIEDAIKDGELELESFDTIICNLVLCSIPNQQQVLKDIQSLLKPGGRLLFIEHVISESNLGSTIQYLINPIWGLIGDGCQLTNKTDQTIKSMNGWEKVDINYIKKPKSLKYICGYAIKK